MKKVSRFLVQNPTKGSRREKREDGSRLSTAGRRNSELDSTLTTSVLTVAKRLGEQSGWTLTPLTMQKLCYIAHVVHLGKTDGEPLITGHFEAWDIGPVHPQLYRSLKRFGADLVQNIFQTVPSMAEGETSQIIDEVVKHLSDNTTRLVSITHWDKGAWARNYIPREKGNIIPNEDILQEWKDRNREFAKQG